MAGPLDGIRIIEIASIGPGPFACMMLADHGAEVIRIERTGAGAADASGDPLRDALCRSRKILRVNLKTAEGQGVVRALAASAQGLVEGFRPGVMERLGLGPEALLSINPALVYGRMTGWGQFGPYAQAAGHDINYIALAGALHAFGNADKPAPPLNMVGDFGGGAMMLAFGMVSALLHAQKTGQGQVIDCAMTDGAALLMTMIWSMHAQGQWKDARRANVLDGGAHFYNSYATADGKYISIGSIEPQFYALLRRLAGLEDDPAFDAQFDQDAWSALEARLDAVFRTRTRDEWCALMEHTDVCFAPVLSLAEAPAHPHNRARETFIEVDGQLQPAPAPRYSMTQTARPTMPRSGTNTAVLLGDAGYGASDIQELFERSVVG